MSKGKGFLQDLRDAGQEKLDDAVHELLSNPRFAETLGRAIRSAGQARGKVDRRFRLALNLANVPTKAYYDDLVRKVVKLGDLLGKLETRVDAIGARLERLAERAARAPKPKR